MRTVGIFEAKSQLSSLIQKVENGEEILLTRHGKTVARLVPPEPRENASVIADWVRDLRAFRKGKDLGAIAGATLPELIAAGRK